MIYTRLPASAEFLRDATGQQLNALVRRLLAERFAPHLVIDPVRQELAQIVSLRTAVDDGYDPVERALFSTVPISTQGIVIG